jgi:hypothetical protein
VASFKPLMEQYKTRVADLETGQARAMRDADDLRFELERVRTQLAVAEERRIKDAEAVALYEERVRELELKPRGRKSMTESDDDVGGDLDDAMAGTTMTDLKLQVRSVHGVVFNDLRNIGRTGPTADEGARRSEDEHGRRLARRRPREPPRGCQPDEVALPGRLPPRAPREASPPSPARRHPRWQSW